MDTNGQLLTVIVGGAERKLDTNGVTPKRGELDWSPDRKTIAFGGGASIFLLSPEDSTVHRLTEPPPLSEDWGPAFSPDGQKVLFVRSNETEFPEEIMAISTNGGEVTRITSEHAGFLVRHDGPLMGSRLSSPRIAEATPLSGEFQPT